MKKRICSILLSLAMLGTAAPMQSVTAYAGTEETDTSDDEVELASEEDEIELASEEEENSDTAKSEITAQTFKDLGLKQNADINDGIAPYGEEEDRQISLVTDPEIYVTANGSRNNVYTLRTGLDRIWWRTHPSEAVNTDTWTEYGSVSGAYGYYGISDEDIKNKYGGSSDSIISTNRDNSLAKESNEFSGIYSTSVAFSSGDGRDNYVAELRAYGQNDTTVVDGVSHKGKIAVSIFRINDDGKREFVQELSPTIDSSLFPENGAFNYFTRAYDQELDALFEIEAADVNGDGSDELFVYCGRYSDQDGWRYPCVDVFYGANGSFSGTPDTTISVKGNTVDSYWVNSSWKYRLRRVPILTMAAGDLKGDGLKTEDICLTVSSPTDNKDVSRGSRACVFECKKGSEISLTLASGLEDIDLSTSGGKALISANCTVGTFETISGSRGYKVPTLIIGGYESLRTDTMAGSSKGAGFTQAGYRYIYYDINQEKYVVSNYTNAALGTRSKRVAGSYTYDPDDYLEPIHAPMALCAADLEGLGADNLNEEVLFGAEVYQFTLGSGLGEQIGALSICSDMVNDNNNKKTKDQYWIGDVVAGCVEDNPSDLHWKESFLYVSGAHRKAKLNDSDDYYWKNMGFFTYIISENSGSAEKSYTPWSIEEGVIARSNSRNDTYGSCMSLCLPDIGDDSCMLKYEGKELIYSDPVVYAVLEASPYFEDLNEKEDYAGGGETSYATSKEHGNVRSSNSVSFGVGGYANAESGAMVPEGGELEIAAGINTNFEWSKTDNVSYSISYSNEGGHTDQAVVYSMPQVQYKYNYYDPTEKTWKDVYFYSAVAPVVSVMDVDDYDAVAKKTRGLDQIRGNILFNTPGDPSTYNKLGGKRVYAYETTGGQSGDSDDAETYGAGASGNYAASRYASGGTVSQEVEISYDFDYAWNINLSVEGKVGFKCGFFGLWEAKTGIQYSFEKCLFSGGHSDSEGLTFTGAVANIPSDYKDYYFRWRTLVNTATLNKNTVWVVGYDVKDVTRPPHLPGNFAVKEVTQNSVTLSWDETSDATYYEIFMVDATGEYNSVATVPYTETECTVEGLASNRTYKFVLRAVNKALGDSIYSKPLTVMTMGDIATFAITKQPADQTGYKGGTATFAVTAKCLDNSGQNKKISYIWQKQTEDKNWENIKGEKSSSLILSNLTEDMDGAQYRCRVYYNDYSLYSAVAKLTVGPMPSSAALTVTKDGKTLEDYAVVAAAGTRSTTATETAYSRTPVSVSTEDETAYTLYKDPAGANFYWRAEGTDAGSHWYSNIGSLTWDSSSERSDQIAESMEFTDATDYVGEELQPAYADSAVAILSASTNTSEEDYTHSQEQRVEIQKTTCPETFTSYSPEEGITYDQLLCAWRAEEMSGWFLALGGHDTEGNTFVDSFYRYTEDGAEKYLPCTITEDKALNGVALSDLEIVYQTTTTDKVVAGEDIVYTGDTLLLQAAITVNGGQADGKVIFHIEGPKDETIEAADNKAEWTPTAEGSYQVYIEYTGGTTSSDCVSKAFHMEACYDEYLTLQMADESVYGDSVEMTLLRAATQEAASEVKHVEDITADDGTSYEVYYMETAQDDEGILTASFRTAVADDGDEETEDAAEYSISAEDGTFTPYRAGIYRIEAAYQGRTAAADVEITKADLTLQAISTTKHISAADRSCEKAELMGFSRDGDAVELERGKDYELSCLAENAEFTAPGKYSIVPYLVLSEADPEDETVQEGLPSEKVQKLQENYNIQFANATYTLLTETYQVSAETSSDHGSLDLSYQEEGYSNEISFDSGAQLPEGSRVNVEAVPDSGYRVSYWTVNGKIAQDAKGTTAEDTDPAGEATPDEAGDGTPAASTDILTGDDTVIPEDTPVYSGNYLQLESLAEDVEIVAHVIPISTTLTYYSADESMGSLDACYAQKDADGNYTDGIRVNSGKKIQANQVIHLTARAEDGYVIDYYTIRRGDGEAEVYYMDEAETMPYTQSDLYLQGQEEDTEICVYFAEEVPLQLQVSAKIIGEELSREWDYDADYQVYRLEGQEYIRIAENEDGCFDLIKGDAVAVQIRDVDGMSIDSWKDAEGNQLTFDTDDMGVKDLTVCYIDSLQTDAELMVSYYADNSYEVNFGTDADNAGLVSAEANGASITSGEEVPQGMKVLVTAYDGENISFSGWTVNGKAIEASDTTYEIPYLNEDVTVQASFVRSAYPVDFCVEGNVGGSLTAVAGETEITAGDQVKTGSDITFRAAADENYELLYWTVNGEKVMEAADGETVYRETELKTESLDKALNVKAYFGRKQCKVTYRVNEDSFGSLQAVVYDPETAAESALVSGDQAGAGSRILLTAELQKDDRSLSPYEVDYWEVNGVRNDTKKLELTLDSLKEDTDILLVLKESQAKELTPEIDGEPVAEDEEIDLLQELEVGDRLSNEEPAADTGDGETAEDYIFYAAELADQISFRDENDDRISGTFAWISPNDETEPAYGYTVTETDAEVGTLKAEWTFTPTDLYRYQTYTGKAVIAVYEEEAEDAPNPPASDMYVSCGSVDADGYHVTGLDQVALPEGWSWKDADQETVQKLEIGSNKRTAVYVGTEETVETTAAGDPADEDEIVLAAEGEALVDAADPESAETVQAVDAETISDAVDETAEDMTVETASEGEAAAYKNTSVVVTIHVDHWTDAETGEKDLRTEVITERSCTSYGLEEDICNVCEQSVDTRLVDPSDHTPETIEAVAPSCTRTGFTEGEKCAVCGKILKTPEELPKTEHTAETVTGTAPTCTETGLTDGEKCAVCGTILKAQKSIAALGHTKGQVVYENEQAADYGVPATRDEVIYCTVCGAEVERKTVETGKALDPVELTDCTVTIGKLTYNGKTQTPSVTVKIGDKVVDPGFYKVSCLQTKNAGKGVVLISASDKDNSPIHGAKLASVTIKKARQTIKVSATKKFSYAKLKKKAQKRKLAAAATDTKSRITYKKVSGSRKITVSKTGVIKVAKGTKKGTYRIKVRIAATATSNYYKRTVRKVIKVVVK